MAREQQPATEHALKITVEEEKTEKIAQVNKLIERVKVMEVKQQEIKQDMEQKLKNVREQTQEKYQMSVRQMQEEYQKKLEQEIQWYISENSNRQGTDALSIAQRVEDKVTSQRKALETAKQMLHQSRGSLDHLKWIGIIMEHTLRLKNNPSR